MPETVSFETSTEAVLCIEGIVRILEEKRQEWQTVLKKNRTWLGAIKNQAKETGVAVSTHHLEGRITFFRECVQSLRTTFPGPNSILHSFQVLMDVQKKYTDLSAQARGVFAETEQQPAAVVNAACTVKCNEELARLRKYRNEQLPALLASMATWSEETRLEQHQVYQSCLAMLPNWGFLSPDREFIKGLINQLHPNSKTEYLPSPKPTAPQPTEVPPATGPRFKPTFKTFMSSFRLIPPVDSAISVADTKALLQTLVSANTERDPYFMFSLAAQGTPLQAFVVFTCASVDADKLWSYLQNHCPGLEIEPETWDWLPDHPAYTAEKTVSHHMQFVLNKYAGDVRSSSSFSSDPFSLFFTNAEELEPGETVIFVTEFFPLDVGDEDFCAKTPSYIREVLAQKTLPLFAAEFNLYIHTATPSRGEYLINQTEKCLAQYGNSDHSAIARISKKWDEAEAKAIEVQREDYWSMGGRVFIADLDRVNGYRAFLFSNSLFSSSHTATLVPWTPERKEDFIRAFGCLWVYQHYRLHAFSGPGNNCSFLEYQSGNAIHVSLGGTALRDVCDIDHPQAWRDHTPPPAKDVERFVSRDILRTSYFTVVQLGLEELASFVHLPNKSVESKILMRTNTKLKPIPDFLTQPEGLHLGRAEYRKQQYEIRLPQNLRTRHGYIVGASGSGKSNLLKNCIRQDIEEGRGLCVIDPHGDLVSDVLPFIPEERAKDVIIFNPSDRQFPVSLNPFGVATTDDDRNSVALTFQTVFMRMFGVGDEAPRMLHLLHMVTAALLEAGNKTFLDIRRFLIDAQFRDGVLETVNDPTVLEFWFQEYPRDYPKGAAAPINTRLTQFSMSPITRNILGQKHQAFNLYDVMNSGQILFCSLGSIEEQERQLLGSLLVSQLQLATMRRAEIPENQRRCFIAYIDEFQNFASDVKSLEKILSEARKYGLGLALAHQYTTQIPSKLADAIMANTYTKIIFRVSSEDARYLQKSLADFTPEDLQNQEIGQAVLCAGQAKDSFTLKTAKFPNPPAEHHAAAIIEQSRKTYGRPRAEVEAELRPKKPAEQPTQPALATADAATATAATSTAASEEAPAPARDRFDELMGEP